MNDSAPSNGPFARLHAWLSVADAPRHANLIFVLAGKINRKEYALELFRKGLAPAILFSVARFEIRRFSKMRLPETIDLLQLAQELPPPQRHYFVFFQSQTVKVEHVPPGQLGTLTELRALARWLSHRPEIRSVLMISGASHLRRIRLCCRRLLSAGPELSFVAVPCAQHDPPEHTSPLGDLREVAKIALYWLVLKFSRKKRVS